MTIRRNKDLSTGWSYNKTSFFHITPPAMPFNFISPFDKSSRRLQPTTAATRPSCSIETSEVSSDGTEEPIDHDRSSRLAALFAALFIVTLFVSIAFVTAIAVLTDGFKSIAVHQSNCKDGESSKSFPSTNSVEVVREVVSEDGLCLTQECVRLAANYLNNMNKNVNPCEDFYEFACGRYSVHKVVPEHEKKVAVLNEMRRDLDRQLKDILESSDRESASKSMKLSQIYYDSCMDEKAIDEKGLVPLMSLISHLGGWQLLTNAKFEAKDYHWETVAGQLALHDISGLMRVFVHGSLYDSQQQIIMFLPPKLLLEKRKFYREAPTSNVYLGYYKTYIMSLLNLLGAETDDETGAIEHQVNEMIDLERRLTRSENQRNHSVINNMISYGDFRKRYDQISWDLFFNDEMQSHLGALRDDQLVNIVDPHYFNGLTELIKSKPISVLHNYMMWRLVSAYDAYLPVKFRKPYHEFQRQMYGITSEMPQWETCVREVREYLSMPLSTTYAHKYFSIKDRRIAEEMIGDLKKAMEVTLLNADWIDEQTRQAALVKLEHMGHKIGFPDSLMNETEVLAPFAGIRLVANEFFENAIQLKKASVRKMLVKMQVPPDSAEWASPIITVDAFHYFTGNEIIFPAGILQFPMFVPSAPSFANYGAIGMGIGHEITHGFDDLGSQYDESGNLRRWWHHETLATFEKKKQCFIAQYGNKIEPTTGKKIDGKNTIGENIADAGGLRIAYQAYNMKLEREAEIKSLPGLTSFTNKQLFFLAFANTWCEAIKPAAIEYIIHTDVHSLGMFRVNVPLQNLPAFAKEFDCPIGSPMNPFEKCRVW
ncbi:hypothetical protein WR25_05053 [Diploscapter pachys]|uniref:Peptidase M13 C-terminal domain-containing protein n=1 Tax=Diploscapter pachys TaxID=2018661 RepID=A0A2A2J538_9BILA|nr:hypothetical protein WR25_05053 [Diploscapter pachys]